ncbi:MAG: aquaporin [Williamsia sp.]|nr:aquaporin [Williamsia sp.]
MNVGITPFFRDNWSGFYFMYGMEKSEREGVKSPFHAYLMEAIGLGGFVIVAGILLIFLEHPSLPVMRSSLSQHLALRRLILGIGMGSYITGASFLLSKRSGGHMNPSVTLAFLSLKKMQPGVALLYILAQLTGAGCAALLLSKLAGGLFSHPLVDYNMHKPRPPHGEATAFVAEAIISFITMFLVLATTSSKRYNKYGPLVTGSCVALFITAELPFSGMSMNPARSFAAALAANDWRYLWIYCTAPVLFMLLAAEVYAWWKEKRSLIWGDKKKKVPETDKDYREIPTYPVKKVSRAIGYFSTSDNRLRRRS